VGGRFDALFTSGRPALLAFAEPVAARLAGVTLATLTLDANEWARQTVAAARLIGSRVVALGFTGAIAAEALGAHVDWESGAPRITPLPADRSPALAATPRWTAFIEALQLLATGSGDLVVMSLLPGPAELARAVLGETNDAALARIKDSAVQLAEQVGRTRPDSLLLREGVGMQSCSPLAYRKAHATIRNVARYYDVPLGFVLDSISYIPTDTFARLQPDLTVILAESEVLPSADELSALASIGGALGAPVDINYAAGIAERLHAFSNRFGAMRWLANASRELPVDADLTAVRVSAASFT
jgi:hypothetical protein